MIDYSSVLPSARDTWLLRAALHDAPSASDAWQHWLNATAADGAEPRRGLATINAMLPLVAWNLRRVGIRVERTLQTHLRSATLTEELRWRRYREICETAFAGLAAAGVPYIGLKGAVAGERYYPSPVLRHADDIDVLVHERDIPRATERFLAAGWRLNDEPVFRQPVHAPPVVHPSGVSLEFHHRLVIPYFRLPYADLWTRADHVDIGRERVRTLSAADALLHAIAHAMQGPRDPRWVADAWFMLDGRVPFDWPTFTATAIAARLALPARAALDFMASRLDASIPRATLDALDATANQATFFDRQAARPWRLGRLFPPPVEFALHYDVPLWKVPYGYIDRLGLYLSSARRRWSPGGGRSASA